MQRLDKLIADNSCHPITWCHNVYYCVGGWKVRYTGASQPSMWTADLKETGSQVFLADMPHCGQLAAMSQTGSNDLLGVLARSLLV